MSATAAYATVEWIGDAAGGKLRLLDQTRLPDECHYIDCESLDHVWEAIRNLRVRGAPAIGVAAAYGVVIGLQSVVRISGYDALTRIASLQTVVDKLASSRPTAVNLFWALERMKQAAGRDEHQSGPEWLAGLLDEARAIEAEDREMCAAIGRNGAQLVPPQAGILTHCNAGALATAGDGTALSVIFEAARQGRQVHVYADETRPLLQGARLTAWELERREIPVTLICDSAAAWVMREGRVQMVITGADRIAANGDTANKIGTYGLAILARMHGIPFFVAAPSSTFDLSLASGAEIPIEERPAGEVTRFAGHNVAPANIFSYNPAFDVTPAGYISAIVTERGILHPVDAHHVSTHLQEPAEPA